MSKGMYQVVVNHEEQYSIWPLDKPPQRGWRAVGRRGTKETCLDYIEEVWTDMKPAERMRLKELIRRL